jgi:hypothetical protein
MAMTRKLVEEDNVLLTLGDHRHEHERRDPALLNSKKVPHLFALSGAAAWDQPQEFPWTIGFLPTYTAEAQIFAQYLLENHPRSRIAVLYQEDGMGKEYLKGLKGRARVARWPDRGRGAVQGNRTQHRSAALAKLKASAPTSLIEFTTPKFAVMAIKRTVELGWKPLQFAASISNSYSAVISAGGPAKCGRPAVGGLQARGRRRRGGRGGGVPGMDRLHAALSPERQQDQRPGRPRLSGRQVDRRRS